MAGSPQERVLAAELLVVIGVQTADALSGAYTGKFSLPSPNRYFATIVVYLMLAGAAMFGEKPAKLAASFGGIAALAILLAPTKASVAIGKPQAVGVSAIAYFFQMIGGGSLANPNPVEPPSTTIPATVIQSGLGTDPSGATIGGVGPNVG